jgi:hypothetical protein
MKTVLSLPDFSDHHRGSTVMQKGARVRRSARLGAETLSDPWTNRNRSISLICEGLHHFYMTGS